MTAPTTALTRKLDPRVERSRQAILDATLQLLEEHGDVGALTVDAVVAQSGVAKTALLRWLIVAGAGRLSGWSPRGLCCHHRLLAIGSRVR